jgi:hypothetical protein
VEEGLVMEFYILKEDITCKEYASADAIGDVECIRGNICPSCGETLSGGVVTGPKAYKLTAGKVGDFITDGMDILVSARARDVFEKNNVKGFAVDETPVEIRKRKLEQQYFYVIPNGVCVRIDEDASGISIREAGGCALCQGMALYSIDRVVIDEASWGGDDFFECSSLCGVILVTSRFVSLVRSHGLTNFNFTPAEEFHYSYEN